MALDAVGTMTALLVSWPFLGKQLDHDQDLRVHAVTGC
jgi:hypothetical protein